MSGRARVLLTAAGIYLLARLTWLIALMLVSDRPHHILTRWDGQWYARIASNGYGHVVTTGAGARHADYAFFPLLPLLERAGHALTGVAPADIGVLVSWTAGAVAAAGICALGRTLHTARVGLVWAALWSLLPISAALALAYADALLVALAAWGLVAVVGRRWATAGILALVAGLARPTGAGLVLTVLIAGLVALLRDRDGRATLAVLLAPIGLIGYLTWVAIETGSATGYLDVTRGWGNGLDGGVGFVRWIADLTPLAAVAVVAGVALVAILLVLLARDREPWPLLLYSAVVVAMSLTTSGYFGSKPRYLLAAFPLLLPVARRLARWRDSGVTATLVALGLIGTAYGVLWLTGPGPP